MASKERLLVVCEKCGKTYKIDPSKLSEPETNIRCSECDALIKVVKPGPKPEQPLPPMDEAGQEPLPDETAVLDELTQEASPAPEPVEKPAPAPAQEAPAQKIKLLSGLRGKMFVLFLIIPIALMAIAGIFYLWQLQRMVNIFTSSSSQIVQRLSGDLMAEASRKVAQEVGLYIKEHPFLKKENFNADFGFKMAGVQKLGFTGYTWVYGLPDETGAWRIWAHVDPDLAGKDINDLKKTLDEGFPAFLKIVTAVKDGHSKQGTYSWMDSEGKEQKRFIVCTPVEGTEYVVVASTPAAEFDRDVKRLQTRTGKVAAQTRHAILLILAVTILLIGGIVAFYGTRLTGQIRALTDAANRISTGDMEVEIKAESKDEIGDLAEAIARMQESIRLSIDRLRRRRQR